MAMVLSEKDLILRFDVPNSEANINAQHFGIVDRTVGSYYMSDKFEVCEEFLSHFKGEYYIELLLTIYNVKNVLTILKDKGYENAFKHYLTPQFKSIEALEWLLTKGEYFYKMNAPFVNDNQKYLKLDNEDDVVNTFRTLILGDLCSMFIKRIGENGFLFFIDKTPLFDEIISNNTILKWMK